MASRYSILRLLREAASGHRGWEPAWRDATPKSAYDVIVVGGGGHGLATAYYLAKVHGVRNVAVVEKGWIGSGNVGRNTTIIRSNYLMPGNIPFYEWSMKLWEGLEQDINYNAMVSQRGVLNLFHSDAQRDAFVRRGNSMRMHGVDAELLDRRRCTAARPDGRFRQCALSGPGRLAATARRHGTARRRRLGIARAASNLGVDIIQNCEVVGIRRDGGAVIGVETTRGFIGSRRIGLACRRQHFARRDAGGPAPADREPRAAGVRDRRPEADRALRRHLRRRPFLHQPVRQGRPGLRRRPSTATTPTRSAATCRSSRKCARKAWR